MSSMETEKGAEQPAAVAAGSSNYSCIRADVGLRLLLLAASIVAVVLMVTSKQTKNIPVPTIPGLTIANPAKFDDSAALVKGNRFAELTIEICENIDVLGLYSIITTIASLAVMGKSSVPAKYFWILAVHDLLVLGLVAAATGTAGGVAYIGLQGNSHVNWGKICNVYDKFCRFIGSSIAVSLFAAVVLVLLVAINVYSLYRRTPGSSVW
ncbi:hypothetical protein Cgig2_029772 [Carnegiea gigantea]|uniref:CASP-like protein n=1 Tax=Carnegiea gigantea TaxID=171969 RepID=A0A9Q1QB39_9CARY|nr:hypothetical protein Cgig2_029772 [Carnegiea gigantea]